MTEYMPENNTDQTPLEGQEADNKSPEFYPGIVVGDLPTLIRQAFRNVLKVREIGTLTDDKERNSREKLLDIIIDPQSTPGAILYAADTLSIPAGNIEEWLKNIQHAKEEKVAEVRETFEFLTELRKTLDNFNPEERKPYDEAIRAAMNPQSKPEELQDKFSKTFWANEEVKMMLEAFGQPKETIQQVKIEDEAITPEGLTSPQQEEYESLKKKKKELEEGLPDLLEKMKNGMATDKEKEEFNQKKDAANQLYKETLGLTEFAERLLLLPIFAIMSAIIIYIFLMAKAGGSIASRASK